MTGTGEAGERRGAEAGPDADVGTPAAWRAVSLAVLGAGLGAGWLLATLPAGPLAALTVAGAALALSLWLAIAGRRPPIAGPAADAPTRRLPTLSVLIPARDEAPVIGRLIADLGRQDHRLDGGPAFEVVVIDDRSTDGTGAAAETAAAKAGIGSLVRIIRRSGRDLADGKGAALTLAQPETCRGEAIVVLDGDARVGPSFLRILAGYLAAGAVAVTPRRRTSTRPRSWLALAQAAEQAQDGALQRGRWAAAGCSELRGNGMTIRRNALAAVGGWRAEELTEDLDLSSRLAARLGVTVAWAIEAVVTEEPVRHLRALWRQRLRWAEGSLRRILEHGREVLASPLLTRRARLDFAAYAGQLAAAPVILGALAAGVAAGVATAQASAGLILVGGYLGAGGLLALVGLRREAAADATPMPTWGLLVGAIRAALFSFLWLAAIPGAFVRLAFRRGPLTFTKTVHAITPPEPGTTGAVVERG